MSDFTLPMISGYEAIGASTAITTSTANTKTAYTQLVASTSRQYEGLLVMLGYSSAAAWWLFDIAIGAAGSEQVILPNLMHTPRADYGGISTMFVPITVPAGVRVAVRAQASGGAKSASIDVKGSFSGQSGMRGYANATDYGTTTATSKGTQVDPGGTVSTKGAYAQLTASCAQTRCMLLNVGLDDVTNLYAEWKIDIAVGGAGSEQIVIPDIQGGVRNTTTTQYGPLSYFIPLSISAGQRIAARCSCSNNVNPGRMLTINMIGLS